MYYWFLFFLVLVVKVIFFTGVICAVVAWLPVINQRLIRFFQPENSELEPELKGVLNPAKNFSDFFFQPAGSVSEFNFISVRIRTLITIAASLAIFAIIPVGRFSINLSPLHPGLADFPLLYISAPDSGLLFLGFCFFLALLGRLPGSSSGGTATGSYRLFTQLFSFQIVLGLLLPGLVFITGTLNLLEITLFQQKYGWLIFYQPVAAIIYLGLILFMFRREALALVGREPELVPLREGAAGRIELFSEYLLLFAFSGLYTALFLGGGMALPVKIPQFELIAWPIVGFLWPLFWFTLKTGLVVLLLFRLAYSWPRLTDKQLIKLCWLVLLPVALANCLLTVALRALFSVPSSGWILFQVIWILGLYVLWNYRFVKDSPRESVRLLE